MAQNRVTCIFQDSRSMIWAGTDGGGISLFDGKEFRSFNTSHGLLNNNVQCFLEQNEGSILVGTSTGLSIYNGYSFMTLNNELNVHAILEISKNNYWLACDKGMVKFKEGIFSIPKEVEALKGRKITSIKKFKKGILIGTSTGIYFHKEGQPVKKYKLNSLLDLSQITDIRGSGNDIIWISTMGNGLFRLFNDKVKSITNSLIKDVVSVCNFDDETVAIATRENGLILYNFVYDTFSQILEKDGLAHDWLSSLTKDKWGNLWVATLGNGISKFSGKSVQRMGSIFGLPENSIRTVQVSDSGSIWFSHSSNKLGKYDGVNFFNFDETLDFPPARINKIFEDNMGRLWIGTQNRGLILKDNSGFKKIELPISFGAITDIVSDQKGSIWLSSRDQGLINFDFVTSGFPGLRHYTTLDGLKDNSIIDMHADPVDGIWVVSPDKGLSHISSISVVTNYGKKEGLSSNNLKSVWVDRYGIVWVTLEKGGLSVINSKNSVSVKNYILDGSLPHLKFNHLQINNDLLLLIHNTGVDKFIIDSTGQFNYMETIDFRAYHAGSMSNVNSIGMSKDILWMGSPNGLVRIDINQAEENKRLHNVSLSKVSLLYDDLYETSYRDQLSSWYQAIKPLVFANDENDIGFEFQSFSPNPEDKTEFQWKLEGYDDDWSPLNLNRSVNYSNLPYGEYRFYVKTKNESDEHISEGFSFRIRKAVYQTWWFRFLVSFLLFISLYGLIKRRINVLKEKSNREKEDLEAQLSILGLEQKALQLQMNPHFIFNTLNSIRGLIVKKDLTMARQQLHKFSSLMRSFLIHSRSESISLQEEIDLLKNYVTIEQFCSGQKFDFEINPPPTDLNEIKIPPMMIQVFVENAIIHGINSLEKRGKIKVSFEEIGNKIKCVIDDNGIGRIASEKNKIKTHDSTAIQVIIDRLKIIHRNSSLEVFKITDKLDKNNTPVGTRITLLLPILN